MSVTEHYLRSEMAVSGRAAVGPEVRLYDVDEQGDNGQDHRGEREGYQTTV